MQSVFLRSLEVTAVPAVIGLEVADDRFDRLTTPELASLLLADPFGLAPVHDVHIRLVRIHDPIAQIGERCGWLDCTVLHQDRRRHQSLVQGVAVVRVAVEDFGTHDRVALERAGNTVTLNS